MFQDFRHELATIHQSELLAQAERERIGRPDRMARHDRATQSGPWVSRVLRRLAGPAFA
jgi:hypothetical protein